LVVVSGADGTTLSEMAERLDIHPTTVSRRVDRLVHKRLVRRSELAGDRRITRLHLTAAGRRLVNRVTQRRSRDLARIVRRMPQESWPAVTESLAAFAAAAGEVDDVDLFDWDTSPA
jgi:DNA-binding MarR family transcriptional regulator